MQADLFWKWSVAPGGLVPVKAHCRFTMTGSNGGGHYVIWDHDRVYAQGGRAMLDQIWQRLTG